MCNCASEACVSAKAQCGDNLTRDNIMRRACAPAPVASARPAMRAVSRSGLAWLCRFPGFARLGADRLSRRCRPDAERPPGGDRCDRWRALRLGRPEIHPTTGRELRFFPDHAGRDAVDIRNVRAAKAKRIAAARLLLILGVGLASARQHRNRQRRCEHQAELELSGLDSKHESPEALLCELWVNGGGLASRADGHSRGNHRACFEIIATSE